MRVALFSPLCFVLAVGPAVAGSDRPNFVRNGDSVGKQNGYSEHLVVDEAVRWLSEGRDKAKPFFLYVCFHEPHEPIASDPKYTKSNERFGKSQMSCKKILTW